MTEYSETTMWRLMLGQLTIPPPSEEELERNREQRREGRPYARADALLRKILDPNQVYRRAEIECLMKQEDTRLSAKSAINRAVTSGWLACDRRGIGKPATYRVETQRYGQ